MKIKLFCILFILISFGCGKTNKKNVKAGTLTVSAAISLKDAFVEIGKSFEKKSGKKIIFNFGASGVLQKQIENSAPVDVFASAGTKQMDDLEKSEFIELSSRQNFARNSLVLIVPKDSKLNIKTFSDLTKPEIEKIAVGNFKTVPAGQYTEENLAKSNLKNSLQKKFIFAENVRQVLDYVVRGEVDAGIVYQTDALLKKNEIKIVTEADGKGHSPILYPMAIIRNSENKKLAQEFTEFILGTKGQEILKKYGFQGVS
jgi:molybdate transport system substrate-binding protein